MKQLRGPISIAAIILAIYIVLALWFDRAATRQHEKDFNTQQSLQVQLSAQSIQDHFAWVQGELSITARHTLPDYLAASDSPESIAGMFETGALSAYPDEELIIGYFTDPAAPYAVYHHANTPPAAAAVLDMWLHDYWPSVDSGQQPLVTPFTLLPDRPVYGLLLPVFSLTDEGEADTFQGILIAMLDFRPVLERYIIPMRSGDYGAAWVQDSAGLVVYDHEPETVGQNVIALSEPYPDLRRVVEAMFVEDSGMDEYHYTVERGGEVQRKLVAWSTTYLGDQRLTVALSAPDSEINASMALFQGQVIVLGALLAGALVASSALFYRHRHHVLTGLVAERTSELEDLTNKLEQRVALRTRQLEQERAQLTTILEAMDDGVLFRQDDRIVYVNPTMARLTGYSVDEFHANPLAIFAEITSTIDRTTLASLTDQYHQAMQRQRIWRASGSLKRKDGSLFDASLFMAQVRGPDGNPLGTVEIIRDVTRDKALRRQRDNFITNAAHELRRPLTNLKTCLYLLKRQPQNLDEHLEKVEQATDDLAELVQDLVDMAQFARGGIELNRRSIILQHVIRAALSIQEPHAGRAHVSLTTQLPDDPIPIHADHQRLMQTFNNLIANAINATTPDGRVSVTATISPTTPAAIANGHTQSATVHLHHNGPALDKEQLALIFEPFFRPSEGHIIRTGLDLALARQIIEQHNGSIHVTSHSTTGTTFTVQLPVDPSPSPIPRRPPDPSAAKPNRAN